MNRVLLPLLLTLTLAATACGAERSGDGAADAAPSSEPGLHVVATTTILGEVVGRVAGDAARVDVLMEPGQDPHAFSPSAQQAQLLREADLVVANGLQLEASLLDALAAAEADGAEVLEVAPALDPIAFAGGGDGHAGLDPHVWWDPLRMADAAELLAARLAAVDGGDQPGGESWAERGAAYAAELRDLDARVAEILAAVPAEDRKLVTNHDSLGYLAARYGFEVIGSVIPGTSTQADPSAAAFAELARTIEREDVPAIFAETTASQQLAEALAAEVGRDVEVVELYTDSLGAPGSGADSYVGLLETNARRIADALAGG